MMTNTDAESRPNTDADDTTTRYQLECAREIAFTRFGVLSSKDCGPGHQPVSPWSVHLSGCRFGGGTVRTNNLGDDSLGSLALCVRGAAHDGGQSQCR